MGARRNAGRLITARSGSRPGRCLTPTSRASPPLRWRMPQTREKSPFGSIFAFQIVCREIARRQPVFWGCGKPVDNVIVSEMSEIMQLDSEPFPTSMEANWRTECRNALRRSPRDCHHPTGLIALNMLMVTFLPTAGQSIRNESN
jgi:hypothetical protein